MLDYWGMHGHFNTVRTGALRPPKQCYILADNMQKAEHYKPSERSLYVALQYATEGRTEYVCLMQC